MDNSFRQQEQRADTQQPNGLQAIAQIFDSILNWLAGSIQLTEEEQQDAGIYLGNQRYK